MSYPNAFRRLVLFAGVVLCLWAPSAVEAGVPPSVQLASLGAMGDVNRFFILFCALLGLVMLAGFYLLELGLVRAKNSVNASMKHLMSLAAISLAFLFSVVFMFGDTAGGWIGTGGWEYVWDGPLNEDFWLYWFFHFVLAAIAGAVALSAMAERARFAGLLVFSAVFATVIYPVGGHWAWGSHGVTFGMGGGSGWLEQRGFRDFAGGTVVHGVGGACALAGVLVAGRRTGRFGPHGIPRLIPGHNLPLATLGAFLVWIGWFGFIAGASGSPGSQLGELMVNTLLAAALGALAAMICRWVMDGRPNAAIAIQGAVAGLVSISAGCDVVTPLSSMAIGLFGGMIAAFGGIALEKLRIDDVVNAVPVHLFAGFWGTLAVAWFHRDGFDAVLLSTQAMGSASLCLAAFSVAFLVFKAIDLTIGLRATVQEQEDGLDFSDHAANGYPDFVTTEKD